ncbi:hypothetical protein V5O48_014994, partial [Marasmius crinis-equi]
QATRQPNPNQADIDSHNRQEPDPTHRQDVHERAHRFVNATFTLKASRSITVQVLARGTYPDFNHAVSDASIAVFSEKPNLKTSIKALGFLSSEGALDLAGDDSSHSEMMPPSLRKAMPNEIVRRGYSTTVHDVLFYLSFNLKLDP